MVTDSEYPIPETVFAAIHGAAELGDIPILAGDNLKDLGLSRLQLLAALIELEDNFAVGEAVQLMSRTRDAPIPLGIYTVVRQLPPDWRELTYRVKSNSDGYERVLREGQLAAIGALHQGRNNGGDCVLLHTDRVPSDRS